MPVASMGMAMTVEMMKAAAESARDRPAIGPAIGARYRCHARTAIEGARLDRFRYGAERGSSHQGQHDAARAFHNVALHGRQFASLAERGWIRQAKRGDFTASCVSNQNASGSILTFASLPQQALCECQNHRTTSKLLLLVELWI